MPEFQVYLENNERLISRWFRLVSNPRSKLYGRHRAPDLVDERTIEKAKAFFSTWDDATIRPTIFKDVWIVKTSSKELLKRRMPKFVMAIDDDPNFHQALTIYQKGLTKKSVQVLPKLPPIRADLKQRFNLECMMEGVKGRSLIASNDSIWAEMPAVTIVAESPKTVFSSTFSRKNDASYQNYFVNVYLWDPGIRTPLKEREFARFGRASPDLTIKRIDEFAVLITGLNKRRIKKGKKPLGFLNYFLYQNPQAFRRKKIKSADYPNSPTFWSANIGLGRVDFDHLEKCANRLLKPPLPLWKWALVNVFKLIGVNLFKDYSGCSIKEVPKEDIKE